MLDAAWTSPQSFRGLSGLDRHFLYLTACATGFRASELASMTPESFQLDVDTPTAKVQAACTKNRKDAVQPLPLDLAEALRGYLRDKPPDQPVWPGKWRPKAVFMVRRDLHEARKTWLQSFQNPRQRAEAEQSDFLTYRDAEGRYADFHALRHSFITMVGKAGVTPREHQDLARHSTYAPDKPLHACAVLRSGRRRASAANPERGRAPESRALPATGTDGREISLGPNLGPCPAISGDFERQAETESRPSSRQENPGKHGLMAVFQGSELRYDKSGG